MQLPISSEPGGSSQSLSLASHLALTDIWHRETDLESEWWVLRVSFAVIICFSGFGSTYSSAGAPGQKKLSSY